MQMENSSKMRFYGESSKIGIYDCTIKRGDMVFVPKNTKYSIYNVSDKNSAVLII